MKKFFDVTGQPYQELVAAAKLTHSRILEIHEGKLPPVTRMPEAFENAAVPSFQNPATHTRHAEEN
jgi:hypothetical protein